MVRSKFNYNQSKLMLKFATFRALAFNKLSQALISRFSASKSTDKSTPTLKRGTKLSIS